MPPRTELLPNQIGWCVSIRSCFAQLLRHPEIGRTSCHIHMDDLTRFQIDDEESKERTKEEGSRLQEIAGPHLCGMMA
jgi:hypothetical protein